MKETQVKITQTDGKIFHAHGLKEYCQNVHITQRNLQIQFNLLPNANSVFHKTRTNATKIYTETQKTPNSQSNPEKE